jgi:hypothetical protein
MGWSKAMGGVPGLFDPVMMSKILVIQAANNLSHDRTECLINNRLSSMRFLDLSLVDREPDAVLRPPEVSHRSRVHPSQPRGFRSWRKILEALPHEQFPQTAPHGPSRPSWSAEDGLPCHTGVTATV